MNNKSTYRELYPREELDDVIHSFWCHHNPMNEPEPLTIAPDSFFKIIILVRNNQIIKYFMTGLWTCQKDFTIPPNTLVYGCRLRILAPEYLIDREISSIMDNYLQLDTAFLNAQLFNLEDFDVLVEQWQKELIQIKPSKEISGNKLRLSQLLYKMNGHISAVDVSNQIFWSNRQINRYLNKYLGVSLKKYLNIQKCYDAFIQIREGEFYPNDDYFDQAHFIKEMKKHTGKTPKGLFQGINDRFLQLKNIKRR